MVTEKGWVCQRRSPGGASGQEATPYNPTPNTPSVSVNEAFTFHEFLFSHFINKMTGLLVRWGQKFTLSEQDPANINVQNCSLYTC